MGRMPTDDGVAVETVESARVEQEADLLHIRQTLRRHAKELGFGLVDETKIITAASELARNIMKYCNGAGGQLRVERLKRDGRAGLRAIFSDAGPGIADLDLALKDGFSTMGSLGLGLGGARRLVDEFHIESTPGTGTTVQITKWVR
jgi:serine/threonine-protein kinase RsbT